MARKTSLWSELQRERERRQRAAQARERAEQQLIRLPVVRTAVEVRLNGEKAGSQAWAPYTFPLPARLLRQTGNELEITVFSAASNKYYGGTPYQVTPEASGLLGAPVLIVTPQ
jgi:hypothetical protein